MNQGSINSQHGIQRQRQLLLLFLQDPIMSIGTALQKTRSMHTHELNSSRSINGEYSTLFPVLKNYPDKFQDYMRMKVSTFEYVLSKVSPLLMKNWCNLHVQPIYPEERLVLTLRFLATGSSYSQLAFSFKMGVATVSSIVIETMNVLWSTLAPLHMAFPTSDDFIKISQDFQTKWDMPHCIGSIDGCHIEIEKPENSGSLYYNFKGYHSIVLQALVDANYRYISIDVGGFGSQHDSATFKASQLYKEIMHKTLNIPSASKVPNSNVYLPYFFIGDGAYPLSEFLMKPYRGTELLHKQSIFNKRLSRARVVVENTFAHTKQKWRILYGPIMIKRTEIINLIIKSTCVLHNVILDLEREIPVQNLNIEQTIDLDDDIIIVPNDDVVVIPDDDILAIPVTGEDIRNELVTYFMKDHLCHKCALI